MTSSNRLMVQTPKHGQHLTTCLDGKGLLSARCSVSNRSGGEHNQLTGTDEPVTAAPTQKVASTSPKPQAPSLALGTVACVVPRLCLL